MKKYIKNLLLTFAIIYTVLNLALYTTTIILRNSMLKEVVTLYLGENRDIEESIQVEKYTIEEIEEIKNIYGEDAPATALLQFRTFITGMGQVIYYQTEILMAALIISITMCIILSLTEKSKTKEILYFILIGLVLNILYTIYIQLTSSLPGTKFFEGFLGIFIENIGTYGIIYVLIYLIVFIFRHQIDKKNMKKLNEEIKRKNK